MKKNLFLNAAMALAFISAVTIVACKGTKTSTGPSTSTSTQPEPTKAPPVVTTPAGSVPNRPDIVSTNCGNLAGTTMNFDTSGFGGTIKKLALNTGAMDDRGRVTDPHQYFIDLIGKLDALGLCSILATQEDGHLVVIGSGGQRSEDWALVSSQGFRSPSNQSGSGPSNGVQCYGDHCTPARPIASILPPKKQNNVDPTCPVALDPSGQWWFANTGSQFGADLENIINGMQADTSIPEGSTTPLNGQIFNLNVVNGGKHPIQNFGLYYSTMISRLHDKGDCAWQELDGSGNPSNNVAIKSSNAFSEEFDVANASAGDGNQYPGYSYKGTYHNANF